MRTRGPLRIAHERVNAAAIEAQKAIDEAQGIGIRAVPAPYPERRVSDLFYKAGAPDATFEGARQLIERAIPTITQAFHDDHIRHNAEQRYRAGMAPKIVRHAAAGCCRWCAGLGGIYDYEDVRDTGNDVFRRHENCRCSVEYVCESGRRDVWSKKLYEADEETLREREEYRRETGDTSPETLRERSAYGMDAEQGAAGENGVANGGERGIISMYPEWNHIVPLSKPIPESVRKSVSEAEETILRDFPSLSGKHEPIRYGKVIGGFAEHGIDSTTGHCIITLLDSVFSDPEQLMVTLLEHYESFYSYEVTSYQSIVAHEMGHNAHMILAMQRCGIPYGSPLSSDELSRIRTEEEVILEEIYDLCFPGWKKDFSIVTNQSIIDFGVESIQGPFELIAQAFGKHYYGKKRARIAETIVQYFLERLT